MKNFLPIACVVSAQQAFGGTLVVLNKSEATASLVDLETFSITATLQTGIGPHEVTISPDGKTAVVANYGDKAAGHSLTLIDLVKGRVSGNMDLGKFTHPHGISYVGNNSEILVTAEDQKSVLKINIPQKKILQSIPTNQDVSHMFALDKKRRRAFVANLGTNLITILDLAKNKKLVDIETGQGPEGIDYSEHNDEIWVANRSANNLTVLDGSTFKIKTVIETDAFPIRVKFTPDQKQVLVTNAQSGTLISYNANTKQRLKTIQFKKGNMSTAGKMFGDKFKESSVPIGIEFDPNEGRAFIAHASLDEISILDLKSLQLIGSFKAGREPDGMAYTPLKFEK